MDSTILYNFDRVTDIERLNIISSVNKNTCNSDLFHTRLLMYHLHVSIPVLHG